MECWFLRQVRNSYFEDWIISILITASTLIWPFVRLKQTFLILIISHLLWRAYLLACLEKSVFEILAAYLKSMTFGIVGKYTYIRKTKYFHNEFKIIKETFPLFLMMKARFTWWLKELHISTPCSHSIPRFQKPIFKAGCPTPFGL